MIDALDYFLNQNDSKLTYNSHYFANLVNNFTKGESNMEYVRLKERDLELLVTVCQLVVDYKFAALANHNWKLFESKYLPTLLQALKDNKFKVASTHDGIIPWIIDNIVHSRRVVEGIPKKDWIPLADIDSVQECLSFLRAARLGQQSYDLHHSTPHYHNLFR